MVSGQRKGGQHLEAKELAKTDQSFRQAAPNHMVSPFTVYKQPPFLVGPQAHPPRGQERERGSETSMTYSR